MPRFVILEHDHPHLHWDLMLEAGDALWTWRLERPPHGGLETIPAERIGDHRLDYLEYEGPVSRGRGSVKRWDWGTYDLLEGSEDRLRLLFQGQHLDGRATLKRSETGQSLFHYHGGRLGQETRMTQKDAHVLVLAGPNGAGKSTISENLLSGVFGVPHFVNADTIARGLSAFRSEDMAIKAGRVMLDHLKELAERQESFAFETTLASRTFAPWLKSLRENGYLFHLFFVWLPSAEMA